MASKVQRKVSLQRILLIALLVVVLIQGLLPLSALVASGVRETLENNAVEVDTHMVDNRKVTLQSAMTTQWNGIAKESTYLNNQLESFLSQNHVDMNAFLANKDLQRAYTAQVYPEMLDYSRRDQTCGDFLVLANDASTDSAATYEGMFLRDSEPTTIADSNSDLLLERGDTSLARQQNTSLDSPWMPAFNFAGNGNRSADDFFYQPYLAAQQYQDIDTASLGYWSMPFVLEGSETGLELANPGNSLLVSVTRALELEPRLQSLLLHDAPEEAAAFRWDAAAGEYRPTQLPEDIPTQ